MHFPQSSLESFRENMSVVKITLAENSVLKSVTRRRNIISTRQQGRKYIQLRKGREKGLQGQNMWTYGPGMGDVWIRRRRPPWMESFSPSPAAFRVSPLQIYSVVMGPSASQVAGPSPFCRLGEGFLLPHQINWVQPLRDVVVTTPLILPNPPVFLTLSFLCPGLLTLDFNFNTSMLGDSNSSHPHL